MDIGIDLGTTFSVIAVKGKIETVAGYPPGKYLGDEGIDLTILPDLAGNYTFPSVFWWEPDPAAPDDHSKGTYAFSWEAKQMAEEGRAPIVFSKRSIGTDEKLMVNGRAFTAKEVATHFLRHMKQCAETVTGQAVSRAVVTHPAYFNPGQRAETLQAAIDAGLGITPDQMMMEPCAAALAFTINDPRGVKPGDPLRVLTYDLGGGTFDVAVMEKIEGVIQMRKFDGDHLLGGVDFDKALVQWVLDQLKAQGRMIPFDEKNPDHLGRRARMLQTAETIKIKLSEQRTPKVKVPVKVDFLVDDKGQRVQFSGSLNQEEYAALIKDELDRTMVCCRRALAEAGWKPEDLHVVLLVGGSTYGPWVQAVVNREFNMNVQPFAPDFCVAAGAALWVAQLVPEGPKNERVELVLDYQTTSSLQSVNIGGCVRPGTKSDLTAEACRSLQIMLTAPDGRAVGPASIGTGGQFLFKDVALLDEGTVSKFTVSIHENGKELLAHAGQITYAPESIPGGAAVSIVPVLPRPLYLKAQRMVSMVEEGAQLPAKCELTLKLNFGVTSLRIPIFLENEEVGQIGVEDLPSEVGEDCQVVVSVEVTQNNDMRGKVVVKGYSGTVVKESPVLVTFPPLEIPELVALRGTFEELKDRLEQEIIQAPAQDRARLAGPGRVLVKKIEKIFAGQQPDRQILNEKIKELNRLVNPPPDDMDPPRREFEALIGECREMIAAAPENPSVKVYDSQLTKVETAGKDACATKNQKKWATANETLRQLAARVHKATEVASPDKAPPTPSAVVLKAQATKIVESLRSALNSARETRLRAAGGDKWLPICEEYANKINRMAADVRKIPDDAPPEQALAQVQSYLVSSDTIRKKIERINIGSAVEI